MAKTNVKAMSIDELGDSVIQVVEDQLGFNDTTKIETEAGLGVVAIEDGRPALFVHLVKPGEPIDAEQRNLAELCGSQLDQGTADFVWATNTADVSFGHFFSWLEDRPVSELIAADHTFLNSRLAKYYGIGGVRGDALQRISLPASSHRGGVLTQGAILKVTANGSTTSPVVRGGWVAERLLGVKIPPPPAGVPAIEPDIRGATTIREQLERHRADAACAGCHRQMDPYGFALESFDPAGRWRDRYLVAAKGGLQRGPAVEPGDQLPDGRSFADSDELKRLLATDQNRLARNFAGHLLVYGTGGELTFADRQPLSDIVAEAAAENYGLRSLIKAVVTSPLFLSK